VEDVLVVAGGLMIVLFWITVVSAAGSASSFLEQAMQKRVNDANISLFINSSCVYLRHT
jgi:hypothetical protein